MGQSLLITIYCTWGNTHPLTSGFEVPKLPGVLTHSHISLQIDMKTTWSVSLGGNQHKSAATGGFAIAIWYHLILQRVSMGISLLQYHTRANRCISTGTGNVGGLEVLFWGETWSYELSWLMWCTSWNIMTYWHTCVSAKLWIKII
jgi:hypothetical protein